jgi:hypothetical protein
MLETIALIGIGTLLVKAASAVFGGSAEESQPHEDSSTTYVSHEGGVNESYGGCDCSCDCGCDCGD